MNALVENALPESVDGDEINLLQYAQILRQRWKWLVGAASATLLISILFSLLATPSYRASSTLQIERDTIKVVAFEGLEPTESPLDRDFYQTQYELLKSRSLAHRVIQDLRLEDNPVYAKEVEVADEESSDRNGGKPLSPGLRKQALELALIEPVLESLTIEPVRNSRLVRVNFDSTDPDLAARITNAYADAFIATNLERRFQASSYAKKYLEERLAQLKGKLEDSEKQLVAFSTREQIVSVGDDKPSLDAQNLGDLNAALAGAQGARMKAEALWRQANSGDGMGLPQVVTNQLIQKLREQRATLQSEYQNKLATFKPDYPDMVQLQQQIEEATRQIQAEVGHIRTAIKIDYEAALAQEGLLKNRISGLKGDVLDLQSRSIQYNILKREAGKNRELYDALLQRYKEIGVAGSIGANNISIIDKAMPPDKAAFPRRLLNTAIGLVVGLLLGVMLAFLVHFLDNTVHDTKRLEDLTGLPVLGAIPRLGEGESPSAASADLRSPFSEAYRSVRTALQFATTHGLPRSMLITSAGPSEGKSTSALELAHNIAQLGKRVVLVDADLRGASLHKTLGIPAAKGLSSLLSGACSPWDAVQELRDRRFSVIPSGPLPPNPPELLGGGALPSLLQQLYERFDVVVLDGPPVLGLADAPLLANHAEATLLIAAAESTRSDALRAALQRLQFARARLVGTVLTRFNQDRSDKSYGYGSYEYGGSAA